MRKRTFIIAAGGGVLATALLLGRATLSHQALAGVLANPAPTDEAMESFVTTGRDLPGALRQLWQTQRIPQRRFALAYLHGQRGNAALWEALRPVVLEAVGCADSELQQGALQMLFEHGDAQFLPRAAGFLRSPDSDMRLAGLMRLNATHDRRWAGAYVGLLEDPVPQVRALAAAGLRGVSGEDFGSHLAATTQAQGTAEWKAWWQTHGAEFPATPAIEPVAERSPGLAYDFTLPDLQGRKAHLADFRGKVVLLNFWATWCPSCAAELKTLAELQARHPEDLVVLGINLDGVSDGDDHDAPPTAEERAQRRGEIQELVAGAKVTYPTLLDPAGSILGPYGASILPTNVLIGADGTIKRRMVGLRPTEAWEALVQAAR